MATIAVSLLEKEKKYGEAVELLQQLLGERDSANYAVKLQLCLPDYCCSMWVSTRPSVEMLAWCKVAQLLQQLLSDCICPVLSVIWSASETTRRLWMGQKIELACLPRKLQGSCCCNCWASWTQPICEGLYCCCCGYTHVPHGGCWWLGWSVTYCGRAAASKVRGVCTRATSAVQLATRHCRSDQLADPAAPGLCLLPTAPSNLQSLSPGCCRWRVLPGAAWAVVGAPVPGHRAPGQGRGFIGGSENLLPHLRKSDVMAP